MDNWLGYIAVCVLAVANTYYMIRNDAVIFGVFGIERTRKVYPRTFWIMLFCWSALALFALYGLIFR